MKIIYRILAIIGLILLLVPALMYYFDSIGTEQMKSWMLLGTVIWFAGAIPWLGRKKSL